MRMKAAALFLAMLVIAGATIAQSPASILASKIKQETGMNFTYKATHSKTSGQWACVVLKLNTKDAGSAIALGVLRKAKAWKVEDYVLGSAMKGTIRQLQEKYPNVPKAIFPKKL